MRRIRSSVPWVASDIVEGRHRPARVSSSQNGVNSLGRLLLDLLPVFFFQLVQLDGWTAVTASGC